MPKSDTLLDAVSGRAVFRSMSLRMELRSPCRFRNSELRSRDNGFDSVKSSMDGPRARPTCVNANLGIREVPGGGPIIEREGKGGGLTSSKMDGVNFGGMALDDEYFFDSFGSGGSTFTHLPML